MPKQSVKVQKRKNKEALLKNVDRLRYGSENFYNRTAEDTLYLKDGDISRQRQFDYKVYKPIRQKVKRPKSEKRQIEDGSTFTIE